MTNTYLLYKDRMNQWRWRYVASNGLTIADSAEGYYNKVDALSGITIMKASFAAPVREA